jgi:FMN phosphatase YigB (HAD superfamily)
MKKIFLILSAFILIAFTTIYPKNITSIFFDVEAIFTTDEMKASSYVGKINSIRYITQLGHLPSQENLFKQLKGIKALSRDTTHNNNLEMPAILCDWLAQLQSNGKIKEIIQKHLSNKNLSDIEIKVLLAVVNMMLTPQSLADVQKVRPKIDQLLKTLRQKGYKLYLVGNWAHISSLKNQFSDLFNYFSSAIVSGDTHHLKPLHEYYQDVLKKTSTNSEQALWIETESKFVSRAKHYGYSVVFFNKDYSSLITGLNNFGISV